MRRVVLSAVVLVALLPLACQGTPIWTEVGDAGNTLGGAQQPSGVGPLTQIVGWFNVPGDTGGTWVDIYRIYVFNPIGFSATTSGTGYDPALFLFDLDGMGLEANQDISTTDQNAYLLGGDAPPLEVYLMIAMNNRHPMSPAGSIFPDPMLPSQLHYRTSPGGDQPFSNLGGSVIGSYPSPVNYTITLTGVQYIPEPASWIMLASGIALASVFLRRRRRTRC